MIVNLLLRKKMKRLFGGKRKYLYLCRQNTIGLNGLNKAKSASSY
jgi:hypothetical protein